MTAYLDLPQGEPLLRDEQRLDQAVTEGVNLINGLLNADVDVRQSEYASRVERELSTLAGALVPAAAGATISLITPGQLHARSLGSPAAKTAVYDRAQYRSGEGPLPEVLSGAAEEVSTSDLLGEERWPALAESLRGHGASSPVLISRALVVPGGHRACLNLYGQSGQGVVPACDVLNAAAVVGIGLSLFLQRRRADNLGHALDSNRLIGAALGVLIARHHWTYDEAFERLRSCSQRTHRKVYAIADEVITTGELPTELDASTAAG